MNKNLNNFFKQADGNGLANTPGTAGRRIWNAAGDGKLDASADSLVDDAANATTTNLTVAKKDGCGCGCGGSDKSKKARQFIGGLLVGAFVTWLLVKKGGAAV